MAVLAVEHIGAIPAGPLRTVDSTLAGWTPRRLGGLLEDPVPW